MARPALVIGLGIVDYGLYALTILGEPVLIYIGMQLYVLGILTSLAVSDIGHVATGNEME